MDEDQKKLYQDIANTIRGLSIDSIQKANSGHPGLPLGCAELGAYLWGAFLRYNPDNPDWFDRDRFVLSAGHGSMFLYSVLHLSGYDVSLEDLKKFRQLNSKTPGHPERLDTAGVEVTTGPLGQGVANAVGIALANKMLGARLNRDGHEIVDSKVVCLAGDGCLMEGVSQEASSLAGHLCLNNLILIYDMNYITLDGEWKESCSDDQIARYKAYGWDVVVIEDANNIEQIKEAMDPLRGAQSKPTIVVAHTQIGHGSPHKAGSHKVHGSPLGEDEAKATKENLNWPQEEFYVPSSVSEFFAEKKQQCAKVEDEWNQTFGAWKSAHPDLFDLYSRMADHHIPPALKDELIKIDMGEEKIAGRKASEMCIQVIGKHLPYFVGGAADLSGSNNTTIADSGFVTADDFTPQNLKFGVREFAMTAMANGISTTFLRPFVGTFFTFSDYAKNAIRLAALSDHPIILIYTHDSIFMGEDGPTHQSIEHLAGLRAMPNHYTFRPGDANEVKTGWWFALNHLSGPVSLILTRQGLPTLEQTAGNMEEKALRGGYILVPEDSSKPIDYTLIGTGSELHLAVDVADRLKSAHGKNVRVVSLPCFRLYEDQDEAYKNKILGGDIGRRVCLEAGTSFGWERYIGHDGIAITMDEFGRSAPAADLMEYFGFTVDKVIERIMTGGKVKA